MKPSILPRYYLLSFILIFAFLAKGLSQTRNIITSPKQYFGFQMGEDRKLARWDRMVDYFYKLEEESSKIRVIDMGPSSEGHPFLVLIISSKDNLYNLDRLQEINKAISDPRGIPEETINEYINEGKAVIFQSMSLHASEVGGTQMAPELAYDLLTRNDEETLRILDNVLFFMIPCFNPDGQIMITDWYNETVGTEYEGLSMPYLYHKYCGHDNNRDGDYLNLIESKYTAQMMYNDWLPQAYIDHHHMGSYGARFYVPPYCEPIRPYADPLIWREMSWYGAHIAYKLEEQGFQGILNAAQFSGWGHFGWHWITPFHNIAGMLTESAGVSMATPVYIHPEQLKADSRAFPDYEAQTTFPNPWPGGWWRLRDIVEQKKSSAWSLLDLAARNKETVLRNAYQKARNQTEKGAEGDIKAVVIPSNQHDWLTAVKMINTLFRSGIEIQKANTDFTVGDVLYAKGSYVISLAQPKMGLIRNLLVETHYPDNAWTRKEDGTPAYPYDLATHTMHEFMGVRVDAKDITVEGNFAILAKLEDIDGRVEKGDAGYIIDGRLNHSYLAVNQLLAKGIKTYRLDREFKGSRAGDFIVPGDPGDDIMEIAMETGVDFMPIDEIPDEGVHAVRLGRLGLFQRYNGGNMDEGWTRLCLENYGFPYISLMSGDVKEGKLNNKFEVIVIPDDSPSRIIGSEDDKTYPEKYRSGIGKEGITALKEFVDKGGTLVALGSSWEFVADEFDLSIRSVTERLDSKEFFCPGSSLWADIDNTNPLAYGMPQEGLVMFRYSPAFEIIPSRHNEDYKTIVRYKDQNLLKSGWLDGEDHITGKPAMISTTFGKGKIVIIGFRTQHRCQTDGTFKLLFNTIME